MTIRALIHLIVIKTRTQVVIQKKINMRAYMMRIRIVRMIKKRRVSHRLRRYRMVRTS
jgi:hypothetical protein